MAEALKGNHHFVPQFWLKRFANDKGQIQSWDGKKTSPVGSASVMSSDWLYTVYDSKWIASNDLENHLSKLEGDAGKAFKAIENVGDLTANTADAMVDFLALQACRHPDILTRNLKRSKELSEFFALAHDMNSSEFKRRASDFGIEDQAAEDIYKELITVPQNDLIEQHDVVEKLTLQDSALPLSDFLKAVAPVENSLSHMNIRLLEAPTGYYFVLGDTPVPQEDAFNGFIAPLSKSLAVEFSVASAGSAILPKRTLSSTELAQVNKTQWENAKEIVIGPDRLALRLL